MNVIRKKPNREKAKDFLDGATLGELIGIVEDHQEILGVERHH